MSPRATMERILRGAVDRIMGAPWAFGVVQSLTDPGRIVPLRRALDLIPHESVLDLGCGIGDLCGMTGAAYTGVDRSRAYVDHARRRFAAPGRRFEIGDAVALDGALGHHDVVAIVDVLHHLSDDEARRCLAGLSVVTPRRLLLVETALERTGALFRRLIVPVDRGRHFRTSAVLRTMLEEAGWRLERECHHASVGGFIPRAILVAAPPIS